MKTTKFKSSEVGPIPVEWEVKRIGDLYDVGSSKRVFQSEWRSNGIPFYRARDLVGFRRGEDAIGGLFIDSGLYAQYKKAYGVPRLEDLLVTAVGTLGVAYRVTNESPFYFKDGNIIWFRSKDLYSSRLLETLFSSGYLDSQIYDTAGGSTVGTYTITNAKKTLIPIPPRPEQEKIAEALSDVDALLSAMSTLIEKKRAIKQGAMQQLLTGKKRLAGFSGKWVEKRLGECFELIGNNTYSREFMCHDTTGIANIHYGDVLIKYGSVLDFSKEQVDSLTSSLLTKSESLKDGDLIIADTAEDETVGKAVEVLHLGARQAVAGLHTIACRPTMEFSPGWLGYYINSSAFHNQLLPLISGTKVSSISKTGLRTTVLTIPPLAEQKAIAAVLSDMDAEIAALEAKRAKYESIKQGMMQELLTGKTRLV